jgi:hypothetical protein
MSRADIDGFSLVPKLLLLLHYTLHQKQFELGAHFMLFLILLRNTSNIECPSSAASKQPAMLTGPRLYTQRDQGMNSSTICSMQSLC